MASVCSRGALRAATTPIGSGCGPTTQHDADAALDGAARQAAAGTGALGSSPVLTRLSRFRSAFAQATGGAAQLGARPAPGATTAAAATGAVPTALVQGQSAADARLLRTAFETANRTAEGRAVLARMGELDLTVEVVDDLPGSIIGTYTGERGVGGTIRLLRSHMQQSPGLAAALLAHEVRHALPGGDEDAAEVTERRVKEALGIPYVRDDG